MANRLELITMISTYENVLKMLDSERDAATIKMILENMADAKRRLDILRGKDGS